MLTLLAVSSLVSAPITGRGVRYFEGSERCPLAGFGSRGAKECVRVALDDDASTVTLEGTKILFRNDKTYHKKTLVGDVLILGHVTLGSGETLPTAVHVFVHKHGAKLTATPHAHAITRAAPVSFALDDYDLVLQSGDVTSRPLADGVAKKTVMEPGFTARVAKELVEVKDNLDGKPKQGDVLADVTVALGLGAAAKNVIRAELKGQRLKDGGKMDEQLAKGDWELHITALSSLIPKDVLRRELFLYDLESYPLLDGVKKDGLAKGQTLVFAMHGGKGTLAVDSASVELKAAADSARAFMEMSFLGAILERQAEVHLRQ